jgi:hypothetical protein
MSLKSSTRPEIGGILSARNCLSGKRSGRGTWLVYSIELPWAM